ncbi:hypothetical protein [Clostridium sp. N3C]|uniref:hypothetical protein n=1 Tax=Clostridium sp. N3C TaxID=1776758 RepID=UPI0009437F2F|nr:hypothetical protein [Clostridium sp. N3C]
MKVRKFDYIVVYLMIFAWIFFGILGPLTFSGIIAMFTILVIPALIIGTLSNIIIRFNKTKI